MLERLTRKSVFRFSGLLRCRLPAVVTAALAQLKPELRRKRERTQLPLVLVPDARYHAVSISSGSTLMLRVPLLSIPVKHIPMRKAKAPTMRTNGRRYARAVHSVQRNGRLHRQTVD